MLITIALGWTSVQFKVKVVDFHVLYVAVTPQDLSSVILRTQLNLRSVWLT